MSKNIEALDLLGQIWKAPRNKTREVKIGNLTIGGGRPVLVQSMTNTDTGNVDATVKQVMELADAGSELVRFTVNNEEAARAVPHIRERFRKAGYEQPLIGDFHYNAHLLLSNFPDLAPSLDKLRINPGNVGSGATRDRNFETALEIIMRHEKPVRIGVNWGSLDRQVLAEVMDANNKLSKPYGTHDVMIASVVKSALDSARFAEGLGLPAERIVLSVKMSQVQDVIAAYRLLASQCDYALHMGLTEAGVGAPGIVASTAAVATLLLAGIGDTLRVSLTPIPGSSRTEEVEICRQILQAAGLRKFTPMVTSCPGCGRTTSTLFQEMALEMNAYFKRKMPEWKALGYEGVESLHIAVMGCVVNGPGESRNVNIGISLPGAGENPRLPVYVDGELATLLQGENALKEFQAIVEQYVEKHWGSK